MAHRTALLASTASSPKQSASSHPHTAEQVGPVEDIPERAGVSASRHPGRLLSFHDLQKLIPVSRMSIWRWEQKGLLPRRFTIGGRVFWNESEVLTRISQHMAGAGDEANEHPVGEA